MTAIEEKHSKNLRVAVVGAGVIGLTTATLFQEAYPESEVTIVADKFFTETTSNVAAGIFNVATDFPGPSDEVSKKWLRDSYNFYNSVLLNSPDEAFEAGILRRSGYIYSTKDKAVSQNSLLEGIITDMRTCTPEELKMFGQEYKNGIFLITLIADCRKYLPYMMKKFKSKGGTVVSKKLDSLADLAGDFDLVFNCSGLGSRYLCKDNTVTSIRGQVYKVNAPWIQHFVYVDYDTYIIPGMNNWVTLGGTRQFGNFKEEVDTHDSAAIWDRCTKVIPSLKNSKIECELAAFRPYRPTIRVEKELIGLSTEKSLPVIHNYGHGGFGVMSAPGTSMAAVQLAIQHLKEKRLPRSKL